MLFKMIVCALATTSALKVGEAPKPSMQKALALRGGGLSLETASLIGAIYNGGFGVTCSHQYPTISSSQWKYMSRSCDVYSRR